MNEHKFAALVVDDEPALRRLTACTLAKFNFTCDEASDGDEAGGLIGRRKYDVVVTDLRMPKRNGHALAVELLAAGSERPLIVVLTGVLEPRLTEDLIARGVDEIDFKPVNYALFGAKIRARCERRAAQLRPQAMASSAGEDRQAAVPEQRITLDQLQERLRMLAATLPVSSAAIEVANLAHDDSYDVHAIAKLISRDSGLSVELLKIANSAFYNPLGQLSDDLHSAILRLGHRKIGELALASANLQLLSKSSLSWMDPDLVWLRSLASGLAMERLQATAKVGGGDESLFLSAMLMPMSLVLTALAFPEVFRQLINRCQAGNESLEQIIRERFEFSPEMAMAAYLEGSGLSARLYKPLQAIGAQLASIEELTEPLRTKVERLEVAANVAKLVVGRFAPWEEIQFPPTTFLRRCELDGTAQFVTALRAALSQMVASDACKPSALKAASYSASRLASAPIRYFKLTVEPHDFLHRFLESTGANVVPAAREAACQSDFVIVNCLDVSEQRLAQFLEECQPSPRRLLIANRVYGEVNSTRGSFISLPCSFEHLTAQIQSVSAR